MEPIALEGGDGARVEMERGHGAETERGRRQGASTGLSFQGPNTDWVTSAAKCCMNIQELSDGQTEERIGERTDGGMALRTDGRTNERRLGSLKFEEGLGQLAI